MTTPTQIELYDSPLDGAMAWMVPGVELMAVAMERIYTSGVGAAWRVCPPERVRAKTWQAVYRFAGRWQFVQINKTAVVRN
jgi:hypothetical protein